MDLVVGGEALPAGTYTLFVDLSGGEWELILSNHIARPAWRSEEPGIWGSFDYSAEKDVLRAPMMYSKSSVSHDQLTYAFYDVTEESGVLALMWDHEMATIEFSLDD